MLHLCLVRINVMKCNNYNVNKGLKKIKIITLYCTSLHCVALRCNALHCVALRCIALHCVALRCIALHCVALRCIALQRVALRCIALHCSKLYCITAYCIAVAAFSRCLVQSLHTRVSSAAPVIGTPSLYGQLSPT